MKLLLLLAGFAGATGRPPAPVAAPPALPAAPLLLPTRVAAPLPLPVRTFTPAPAVTARLSNGLQVVLVENHEVPLVNLRIAFMAGSFEDPVGHEGLAAATAALLTQGVGAYDADAFSRELRKLGSDVSAAAGDDGMVLAASALTRNLAPTLDLLRLAWTAPTFPQAEWEVLRGQMLDGVTQRRTDPNAIADHVLNVVRWGAAYQGRAPTEASIARLNPKLMKRFAKAAMVPEQAVVLVGGDITLAELVPLLEARFGALKVRGRSLDRSLTLRDPSGSTITLVDKPGASQSVILAERTTGGPRDADYPALVLANASIGGMFTSRLNMNLREDKGYTYGARSSVGWDLMGAYWTLQAPVQTDATVPALKEILIELGGPASGRPITPAELEKGRGSIVHAYPLKFEEPGWLLGQNEAVWRYNLGVSWITDYLGRIEAVTTDTAQAAWIEHIGSAGLQFVIVGDAAKFRETLKSVGLPIEERDVDGNLIPAPGPAPAK